MWYIKKTRRAIVLSSGCKTKPNQTKESGVCGTRAKRTRIVKTEHAATSSAARRAGRYHKAFSCALTVGSSVCYSWQSVCITSQVGQPVNPTNEI